jgi:hypothetical protein
MVVYKRSSCRTPTRKLWKGNPDTADPTICLCCLYSYNWRRTMILASQRAPESTGGAFRSLRICSLGSRSRRMPGFACSLLSCPLETHFPPSGSQLVGLVPPVGVGGRGRNPLAVAGVRLLPPAMPAVDQLCCGCGR